MLTPERLAELRAQRDAEVTRCSAEAAERQARFMALRLAGRAYAADRLTFTQIAAIVFAGKSWYLIPLGAPQYFWRDWFESLAPGTSAFLPALECPDEAYYFVRGVADVYYLVVGVSPPLCA